MGSVRSELRRFEKRRLRPVLQRLKRCQPEAGQSTVSGPMEQLLAALIRSEIRRVESKPPVWSSLSATLQSRFGGNQPLNSGELESLVRTMLATPITPPSSEARRDVA